MTTGSPVRKDDLYDLASVTKISSTLPGLMLLNTEGKFSPDQDSGILSSGLQKNK